mgnify:CR=1 FL=1
MLISGVRAIRMKPTFRSAFDSEDDLMDFLHLCVGKREDWDPDDPPSAPMVHPLANQLASQVHEIVVLADSSESDYLKLVLLLTLAESTAKVVHEYHGERESEKHCQVFFEDLRSWLPCGTLLTSVVNAKDEAGAVRALYKHRCKAIHEGWLAPWRSFEREPWKGEPASIYKALRHVVVMGSIRALLSSFQMRCTPSECPGHEISGLLCSSGRCRYSLSL